MLKKGLIFIVLLSVSVISFADTDFAGVYKCHGTDPYLNKAYTGTVTVTHQHSVYKLEMDYDTGETANGTGGQYDATLMSVVFQDKKDPKKVGLEQYTFTPNKQIMQGYWVYLGQTKLGTEICERQEPMTTSN